MRRSRKLIPVKDMAIRAEEAEMVTLSQLNDALFQAQAQLNDLIRYREEYLERFRRHDIHQLQAKKNLELRAFLAHLDQAIEGQQSQVEQHQLQVNTQQQRWLAAKNKLQAIQKLMDKYDADEALLQSRQSQRENDEYTQTLWLRRHHSS
jgi:flagellar FliJ protein